MNEKKKIKLGFARIFDKKTFVMLKIMAVEIIEQHQLKVINLIRHSLANLYKFFYELLIFFSEISELVRLLSNA